MEQTEDNGAIQVFDDENQITNISLNVSQMINKAVD